MRISHALLIPILCTLPALCAAQAPPTAAPPEDAASSAPTTLSGLVQPSLDTLQQTLGALKLEKWKRGTVREESDANIKDILQDLQTTLPPIIAAAEPGTISKVLPVFRNIDALYDVFLRVVEGSRVAAPADQVTQLQEALISLGKGRRALAERIQESALAQEKQIADLKSTLQAQAAAMHPAPPPVALTCPAPAPARKAIKKKPKPPATAQQKPTPAGTPAKPGSGN